MNQLSLKMPVVGNIVPLGWEGVWKALHYVFKKTGNGEVVLSFYTTMKRENISSFELLRKDK